MPAIEPPAAPPGTPVINTLPSGSVLRRLHSLEFTADSFNPTPKPDILSGGRFDSLDGRFSYTYLGEDDDGAVAETVCRDLPFDGRPRLIPIGNLDNRAVTSVEVIRDLELVNLSGADLAQLGQDVWLTKCDADQYLTTRRWAARILTWCPTAAGFRYRCRHDEDRIAYALFDDGATGPPRSRGALRELRDSVDLTSVSGIELVRRVARRHNATVA